MHLYFGGLFKNRELFGGIREAFYGNRTTLVLDQVMDSRADTGWHCRRVADFKMRHGTKH